MTHADARPYIWMLCGSFSFSVMAVLAEALTHATAESPPLCDWQTVAVFRAALVAIFAAILAKQASVRLVWWRPARLWVRSIAGSCSMVCTFYAFGNLRSSDVVTLSNTFPLWVAVLSWPLYGRLPSRKTFLAIIIGVIGVALVEQPHWETGNWGVAAALAAAAFTAIAMLGLHHLHDIDPRAVVVHFSVVATGFCVATYFLTPRSYTLHSLLDYRVALMLLGIGISATIGQVFLTLAFGRGAPAKVSVVGLMQIVFVLLMSIVIFDHPVNGLTLLGTVLVVAPTAWLLTQPKTAVSPASSPHPGPTADAIPTVKVAGPPQAAHAVAQDHPLDSPALQP
ncbi:MAG: DMT family transporter [Gemmataceae bacterium]|nr:DMT family transporter [Gemmata sp.]MDW8197750.1 DMT family transporter [Gemmataceae bacterium]